MNNSRTPYFTFAILIITHIIWGNLIKAQTLKAPTVITGKVVDAETNEPLPMVNIAFEGTTIGTTTNMDGEYKFRSTEVTNKIKVSFIGYESKTITIQTGKTQTINIKLNQVNTTMNEVMVTAKKQRFKKKNNPAIDLIDSVIANKRSNKKEEFDYYEYEKYEKLQFALSHVTEEFRKRRAFKDFQFVFNNLDTTNVEGAPLLPIYLKENISDFYYRKSPKDSKEIIKARKMVGFEGYVDDQGMGEYFKYLYQDINIYDNNVTVLTNQFLSPVAISATLFYKYYIVDTTEIDNQKCIKLFFSPYNKTDLLFQGYMYIMPQERYALRKIELYVNKNINLNWVRNIKVKQEFAHIESKGWMKTSDEIGIDFGLTNNGMGVYGQRSVSYKNYHLNQPRPDSIFKGIDTEILGNAETRDSSYWISQRHEQLDKSESGVYATIDSVKKVPAFKRTMNLIILFIEGYKDLGYVEIGPLSTFYSYKPIEGTRLRFGGRTTQKFSKKINFETYGAYGFTDEKWKYYFATAYSFTDKAIYQFPVKSIKASYQYDTKIPGQLLQYSQEDNIWLSIKRGVNDKLFYNRTARFEYLNEFANHFSIAANYQHQQQTPAGNLYFNYTDYALQKNDVPQITTSELGLTLRYAPHEQFYQGKSYRTPIASKYPVIQLQYTYGSKYLGSDYNYQNVKFAVSRRFNFSVLGYSDVIWESGKVFGKVPYPLLMIHRANQTYSYQPASYNLMNFLEFVSDEYTSLNIDHCFNGFFFNKIPLFKRLKLREVATCKIIYGAVSEKNNPKYHTDLFKFPTEPDGKPITYTLEKAPYVELSVGVSNIFKLFRVDIVKRVNYLDHPNVNGVGIRALYKLDF